MREWTARIFEDAANPVALLREVIKENQLSSEELLHKMKLRIWDDALTQPKFNKCLRMLDPTLTDVQLKAMAAEMKDNENKVPVMTLVQNLVGNEFETYDFRNRMLKRIYTEIREQNKEEKLKHQFYQLDKSNDGTLGVLEMKQALVSVITSVDELSIDKFVKFLEKDKRGRISYTQLFEKIIDVSNKQHNPFQLVV